MITEGIARGVGPDLIDLAWERRGPAQAPTVLLIMGIAAQLVHWPEGFLDALVARGLSPLRFDNRDAGLSTHLSEAPPADLPAALGGDLSSASYTLSEMAADAVGLLDALGVAQAHVVGASLGGAIGQTLALEHPSRALSLCSMMSTTGAPGVGQVRPEVMKAVFGGPPARTREDGVARALRVVEVVGSPGYPPDLEAVAATAALAWERDHDEAAVVRQAVASVASGDRTRRLGALALPTLVIHGLADGLCDPSGGRETAAAIPGAELRLIEGMGHNLPPGLWEPIADAIAGLVARAQRTQK